VAGQGRNTKKKPPETIIIVKKVRPRAQSHGGSWKVAYADFVTAMFALFIVLWLLGSEQSVQKAVGGYFSDATGDGQMMGSSMAGSGRDLKVSADNAQNIRQKIRSALERQVVDFKDLKHNVVFAVTNEGLRIELIENETGTFFDSGRASPTSAGSSILATLGTELGKVPNRLVIEGHTDSRPYANSDFYSNWDLSVERANSARRMMQKEGLQAEQVIEIRGFADQQPRLAGNPEDPSNRRVTVIVRFDAVPDPSARPATPVTPGASEEPSAPGTFVGPAAPSEVAGVVQDEPSDGT
jgi:chemotaxis protein MotB